LKLKNSFFEKNLSKLLKGKNKNNYKTKLKRIIINKKLILSSLLKNLKICLKIFDEKFKNIFFRKK